MANISDHQQTRLRALQRLVIDIGRQRFDEQYGDLKLTPVVGLICAYEEEANIADVLRRVPKVACGLEVTPLVIVDGGRGRDRACRHGGGGRHLCVPGQPGHGVALRVGYDLCVALGAQYVVTFDADGQNDPVEIPQLLQPLVDDGADFVVASRRLGVDKTADRYRQLGVVFFATLMNLLTGSHLTDTSNGFRALRATMLADVKGRLEQDQYQTAELLVTSLKRGWRVTSDPPCGTSGRRASRKRAGTSSTASVTRQCCSGPGAGSVELLTPSAAAGRGVVTGISLTCFGGCFPTSREAHRAAGW